MKTFKFSLVLRTCENTDVFITLTDNIYGIHSKRVNILYRLINLSLHIFIPHHTIIMGYYSFMLEVCLSVRPSIVHPSAHPLYTRPSVCISFPDDDLSKHQWIFTKLGMCIDIVEICFGIANGQISLNFDS